jgi:homocysteine S-methyltransferase
VNTGFSVAIGTATWRANEERIRASSFLNFAVNEDNVQFLKDIRASYSSSDISILIEGSIGPKGDAYKPEEALNVDLARSFHSPQVKALVSSGVDYLQASTFPALSEGMGVALVMAETGLPYVVSFVVDKAGCLLDGTKLSEAIIRIDDKVGTNSARFAINCVHPRILQQALDKNPGIEGRIISFHGNTSDRSAAEIDGSEELITEEPDTFALAYKELLRDHDIKIIGGCCGSNPDHIRAIAKVL